MCFKLNSPRFSYACLQCNLKYEIPVENGLFTSIEIEKYRAALKDTKLDVVGFCVSTTYSKWENRMVLPVVTSIKPIIRKGRICVAVRALGDRSNEEPVNRCSARVWTRINAALSLTQLVGVSRSIDFEELCNAKLICLNREHMWQGEKRG